MVGIGGAGKTAVVDRFLQVLPGGYPDLPEVRKDPSLPAPDRLFIFSFYESPNVDLFFDTLGEWLAGARIRPLPYPGISKLLAEAGHCLLVLDGLEKIQEDGARGSAFGALVDAKLRTLLLEVADGWLPDTSLIITSRLPLYDLEAEGSNYYRRLDIDELSRTAAVHLLRKRGVNGSDVRLERIAADHGFHALTIDLIGGYVALYCGGDADRLPRLPEFAFDDEAEKLDGRLKRLRKQELRLARVVQRYRDTLEGSDPAALALLERICLFRTGVDALMLATIFTGPDKERVAGRDLAKLSRRQIELTLELLARMSLIEGHDLDLRSPTAKATLRYAPHPAVREGLLRGLERQVIQEGHEAVRQELTTSLGGLPGSKNKPSDPGVLDLMEETIFHTFQAGHSHDAWDIFWDRMGSWEHVGSTLGDYQRVERICRMFTEGKPPDIAPIGSNVSFYFQVAFLMTWGHSLAALGDLKTAVRCYERSMDFGPITQNKCRFQKSIAWVRFKQGHLQATLKALDAGIELAEGFESDLIGLRSDRYHVRILRGKFAEAEMDKEWVDKAMSTTGTGTSIGVLWSKRIRCWHGWPSELRFIGDSRGEYVLLDAETAFREGDLAEAKKLADRCREWATARDVKELLCLVSQAEAKIQMAEAASLESASLQGEMYGEVTKTLEGALRIARGCGFGLIHIDLLLELARLRLLSADPSAAETAARTALFGLARSGPGEDPYSTPALDDGAPQEERGIFPSSGSGLPELLAATNPECGYAWAEAQGRHLLAEALLRHAVRKLGTCEIPVRNPIRRIVNRAVGRLGRVQLPPGIDALPRDVYKLVAAAHEQLVRCLRLRERLGDARVNETRDLLRRLRSGRLPASPSGEGEEIRPYDVALSFAGEDRHYATELAAYLEQSGVRVFCDTSEQAHLWGKNLYDHLTWVYKDAARYCVIFLSRHYVKKRWTQHERQAAQARAFEENREYILPIRLDDTEIPGFLPTVCFGALETTSLQEIAHRVVAKLQN